MLAIHDPFSHQMCNHLETIGMGLGLVRLLQDAKRFDEAKAALCALENGFQNVAERSHQPRRLKGVTKPGSCSSRSASIRIDAAEALTPPLSIA